MAENLGLSAPAVSNALARLRRLLGDELFLSTPKGMKPTPYASQLAESVPQNLKVLGQDLERNFKTLLQSGIERMELVSREEFDVQRAVLERTRGKLEAMEGRLAELEKALSRK